MIAVQDAAKEFLLAGRANGLKAATLQWYRHMLSPFVATVWGKQVDQVQASDIRRFVIDLRERPTRYAGARQRPEIAGGLSAHSLRDHVTALRVFFNWCGREYKLDPRTNPMANIRTPKADKREPKAVALDDIRRLLQATDDSPAGRRDHAVISFLSDTGCRAAGLLGLALPALDLTHHRAVVFEKGDRERVVPYTAYTAQRLRLWLDVRPAAPNNRVFVALGGRAPGQPLTLSGLHGLLKRLKVTAGITGRVNPHAFRHALARHYLLNGGKIEILAEIMGHSSITVTQRYARFTDEELFINHELYSPLSNLGGV